MAEKWKPIPNYPGYLVSDEGRVMSVKTSKPRILSPFKNTGDFLYVHLMRRGYRECPGVHRLVAEAFIPNPGDLYYVKHKDGDKTNNVASNLEWRSGSELALNSAYIEKMRTSCRCKIEQLTKTGEFIREWASMTEASKALGISISGISQCCAELLYTAGGYVWRKVKNE
jgi:hypothetical protein